MPLPKGDVSVFYYKSKLNILNFTVYNLQKIAVSVISGMKATDLRCEWNWEPLYFDTGQRKPPQQNDFKFYSDSRAGQQKNKFMIA